MWDELIDRFVESERSRGLRERRLVDLRRQLGVFAAHVGDDSLLPEEVTAGYLRNSCVERAAPYGYATAKAVVWSVKGRFGWLKLKRYNAAGPSAPLRYPRLLPRRQLPQYLEAEQLRTVAEPVPERRHAVGFRPALAAVRRGKNRRQRLVFVNDRVLAELQGYRELSRPEGGPSPVFPALRGAAWSEGRRLPISAGGVCTVPQTRENRGAAVYALGLEPAAENRLEEHGHPTATGTAGFQGMHASTRFGGKQVVASWARAP